MATSVRADLGDADDLHAAVATAVGAEVRRARESVGLTRAELVSRLPSGIHAQSLSSYERGDRQLTAGRLVEICGTVGVSAPDLLRDAMQLAQIDLPRIGVTIDLEAILKDSRPELLAVRRWAGNRRTELAEADIAHVAWPAVRAMATVCALPQAELVSLLIGFTPSLR